MALLPTRTPKGRPLHHCSQRSGIERKVSRAPPKGVALLVTLVLGDEAGAEGGRFSAMVGAAETRKGTEAAACVDPASRLTIGASEDLKCTRDLLSSVTPP